MNKETRKSTESLYPIDIVYNRNCVSIGIVKYIKFLIYYQNIDPDWENYRIEYYVRCTDSNCYIRIENENAMRRMFGNSYFDYLHSLAFQVIEDDLRYTKKHRNVNRFMDVTDTDFQGMHLLGNIKYPQPYYVDIMDDPCSPKVVHVRNEDLYK